MPAPLEVWIAKMQHWKQNTYPAISLTSFATPLASLQRNFANWWWLFFLKEENVLLLFILDPVHRMTWLWCQTCCWCCTWWACCPCPRTPPGCRLARRQRSSPTQTSGGSPMSWSIKTSVSKTHDNKLSVNLYLVAGPGIPNNQLSVQRPADLLIVVKIKMSHFFFHVTTTLTSLYKICVSNNLNYWIHFKINLMSKMRPTACLLSPLKWQQVTWK